MTDAEKILELQEQIKTLKRSVKLMCTFGTWDDCSDCPCYDLISDKYNCNVQSAGLGSPTLWKKGKDF
mgnify:CR=1 FL=1